MKIGIDISLTVGEKAGVGYYSANLVEALAKIDKKNQYLLYPFFYHIYHPSFKNAVVPSQGNFHLHMKKIPKKMIDRLWNSSIPKKWLLGNVDILHSTTFCSPKDHFGKLIVTIYDISFLTFPEYHTEANRMHCLKGTIDAIKYADKIIAISHHGKAELVKYFNIDPEKIVVTPLAVKEFFKPSREEEKNQILFKYNIPQNYIFFLGSYEPRKNIIALIKAYSNLPESIKDKHPLVIAGGKGWLNADINALVKLKSSTHIKHLGYVEEHDLPALYSAATIFIYPSFYEGFGLPVLEAMSCGTPVITSNTSSMPEIGGDAALYFDPTKTNQLEDLLLLLINNADLRENLRSKGLVQAKKYSWEKTAKETLRIYEEAYYS